MSGTGTERNGALPSDPYEPALRAAVREWEALAKPLVVSEIDQETRAARKSELKNLILMLAARVAPERRAAYLREFEIAQAPPSMRGGATFNNVINLLEHANRCRWKASEIQSALAERGVQVDSKALSNVVGYMVKSGRLKRLARGHYWFEGGVLVTAEELRSHDILKGGEMED